MGKEKNMDGSFNYNGVIGKQTASNISWCGNDVRRCKGRMK